METTVLYTEQLQIELGFVKKLKGQHWHYAAIGGDIADYIKHGVANNAYEIVREGRYAGKPLVILKEESRFETLLYLDSFDVWFAI